MLIPNDVDPEFTKWFNEWLVQDESTDTGNSYIYLMQAFDAGKKSATQKTTEIVSPPNPPPPGS